jgi:hypothetical protein
MYKVNVAISYGDGAQAENHLPGETAELAGWPADDLARFLAQGIIEKLPDRPASKPPKAQTPPKEGE